MYAYLLEMPGVDEATQRRIQSELGDEPISGLVAHVSGPVPGGWRVIDIWHDRAAHAEFERTRLMPAVTRATEGMPPPSRPFESVGVDGLADLDLFGGGVTAPV